jgi:hypothetical protein
MPAEHGATSSKERLMQWEGKRQWDDYWGSVHESAHAVTARYFGHELEQLTMWCASIPAQQCHAPNDRRSIEWLIISAAGDAATRIYFDWSELAPRTDYLRSVMFLLRRGAGPFRCRRLLRGAREKAEQLVQTLKPQILAVAAALREHRTLTQSEIDALIKGV